jgi:hypothetical protein
MSEADGKKKATLVPWLYLSLGLTQAANSVEEVLTGLWKNMPIVTGLIHARVPEFPVFGWSADGFAAANLVIVAVLLALSPFPFLGRRWAMRIVSVVAVIEIINGMIHILPAIIQGGYYSGCISAVFLVVLGIITLIEMRRAHGYQTI